MGLLKKLRSFNKLYYLKLKSKVQLPLCGRRSVNQGCIALTKISRNCVYV